MEHGERSDDGKKTESQPFDAEKYYESVNKRLKNRAFQDVDAATQHKLNEATLKNWRRRVNPVDMAYADALALGGWDFFLAYASGALDSDFATSVLKALRKREAQHDAKLIQAVIATSSVAALGGKKARSPLSRLDKELNKEAYDGE